MVHYAPGTSAQRQRGWRSCRYWVGFRADSFHAIINSLQCGSAWKRATRSCHMQEKVSYAWTASWASSNICFTIPWSWGLGSQNMHALGRFVFFHIFYVSTRLRGVCCSCYSFVHCLLQICVSLVFCLFCASAVCLYTFQCCLVAFLVIEQSLLNSWYKL